MAGTGGSRDWTDGYWWSNDSLRLHFRDYPAADPATPRPPIICIPGLTRNARDFHEVAAAIGSGWRVLAIDLRGRGDSGYAKDPMSYVPLTYVQDVEALIASLNLDRFILFGTSLGGIVAMLMASTRPGRVKGALLNDVGPEIDPDGLARIRTYVGQARGHDTWVHAGRAMAEMHGHVYPGWTLADWIGFAKRTHKLTPAGKIVPDYDMRIAEPFRLPGGETGVDLWPALNGLQKVPTLVVRGEASDILSVDVAARMMGRLDAAEVVTVPGVGHAPTLGEPEARQGIDRLLERVVGG